MGQARAKKGRLALLAAVAALLAACTVSTAGQAARAVGAAAHSVPAIPTVTVTTVHQVPARPRVVYRPAPAAASARTPLVTGLGWWAIAVDTNHSSSLTTDAAHDDSADVYVAPTAPVQPKNAADQPNSSAGNTWSGVGLTARTNGQLIGISGDQAYTCSGTVVHSAQRNMVLTAGHCVWNIPVGRPADRGGTPMTLLDTIWFVPGASGLSRPLTLDAQGRPAVEASDGIWKVAGASSNDRWLQNTWVTQSGRGIAQSELMHGVGSYDDIAFVTLAPLDGRQIESVTGAQGLLFSNTSSAAAQVSHPTVILGYPSADPFDGTVQRYCAQKAPDTYDGDTRVQTAEVACALTPGASGGAWFTGFDNVDGVGYVYGVTSRGGDSRLTVGMLSLADDYPLYRKVGG